MQVSISSEDKLDKFLTRTFPGSDLRDVAQRLFEEGLLASFTFDYNGGRTSMRLELVMP